QEAGAGLDDRAQAVLRQQRLQDRQLARQVGGVGVEGAVVEGNGHTAVAQFGQDRQGVFQAGMGEAVGVVAREQDKVWSEQGVWVDSADRYRKMWRLRSSIEGLLATLPNEQENKVTTTSSIASSPPILSPEVWALAEEKGAAAYLPAVLEMTLR